MTIDINSRAAELLSKHRKSASTAQPVTEIETVSETEPESVETDATPVVETPHKTDILLEPEKPKTIATDDIPYKIIYDSYLKRPFQTWEDQDYVKAYKLLHKIPNIIVDAVLPDFLTEEFPGGKYAFSGSIVREHVTVWANGAQTKHNAHYRFVAVLIEPPKYPDVLARKEHLDIHHYFHWVQVIKNNPIYNNWMKLCAYNNIELITHNEIAPLFLALDALNEPIRQL